MNVALSDLDGQRSLSRQRIGDGSATLETTRRRNTDATLNVQVTKLDTIADETFSELKFIKRDVEGHERNVFGVANRRSDAIDRWYNSRVRLRTKEHRISTNFSAVSDTQGYFYWETGTFIIPIPTTSRTTSLGW
jgi:hypothetical protein